MPEVVYASPDANGKSRNWDDVFPIWKLNAEGNEWRRINQILENIAINNRFGGKTTEELQNWLSDQYFESVQKLMLENEEKLRVLPNPPLKSEMFGTPDFSEISEEDQNQIKEVLKERHDIWTEYGMLQYYVREVFNNLGGAYREHKG